jgi:hypothetical protein
MSTKDSRCCTLPIDLFKAAIKHSILFLKILMTNSNPWKETKDLVSVFEVDLDELPTYEISPTVSFKMPLDHEYTKLLLLARSLMGTIDRSLLDNQNHKLYEHKV